MKHNFLAIWIFHCLSGLVFWLGGGTSAHFDSDCFSEEHVSTRLCSTFCCRIACLCTVAAVIQVDGFSALEELVVTFFDAVGSSEVAGHLWCR